MGDRVTARLPLLDGPAKALEGFAEEGFDVVRLKPAGLSTLHVLTDSVDPARVHGVDGKGALFEQILDVDAVNRIVHHGIQPRPDLRPVPVADRLDQQIAQCPALEPEPTEDIEDLSPQGFAYQLELFQQPAVDIALAGLGGDQVPQMADLRLPDTVNAPKALLQAVGVPGKIVVDHQVGALQVNALACSTFTSGSWRKASCTFSRSSRPMPPWIAITASDLPSSVVMRVCR